MSTPNTPAPKAPAAAQPAANTTQNPTTTGQQTAAQPTPQEVRKMKLKLDGKEVELPESDVIAFAQQGKVANQRFQEAAAMRKQAEEIIQFAKQNPKEFFQRTGMNARQWAEEYLMQELQTEAMSPEQRQARENEEKLRKYEAAEKQRKDQEHQAQVNQFKQQHMDAYDKLFVQALNESGLPKTHYTIKRMAELQLINIKNKYELSASQLAKLVREDYADEQKSLLGALDGDQLMEFLGADAVKKLSKAQIAKLKAKGAAATVQSAKRTTTQDTGGLSWRDYQKKNRGRI